MKNVQVRISDELKMAADSIFDGLGTSTNEAIKIFLQMSVYAKGFPFEIKLPDTSTLNRISYSPNISKQKENGTTTIIEKTDKLGGFPKNWTAKTLTLKDNSGDGKVIADISYKRLDLTEGRSYSKYTFDGDFADVPDGDTKEVLETAIYRTDLGKKFYNGAILERFNIYQDDVSAMDRTKLFVETFVPYLVEHGLQSIAFRENHFYDAKTTHDRASLVIAFTNYGFLPMNSTDDYADAMSHLDFFDSIFN
ncbi:type II toxin-antitoxin system RelB/DinJ family antitoxin [Companilactobacillus ginsenosidimutans]|uniref:type II toxin-antitoxin system RelB/DinJ family antitoxin n=1 Tax=Companilactobacillus ginsenosidimutans TaxID=1007676 RepID=UPI00069CC5A3|nr:type II toxin-antitoxin system RelB/DinJ family antitoxin [Companilactobacillus ginsenosidimutans]